MSTETCVLTNIVTTTALMVTTTVIPIATDTVTAMGITTITTETRGAARRMTGPRPRCPPAFIRTLEIRKIAPK